MQITQITPAANQPKKDASTALQGLGNDLDTFLTMLTTQLKYTDNLIINSFLMASCLIMNRPDEHLTS